MGCLTEKPVASRAVSARDARRMLRDGIVRLSLTALAFNGVLACSASNSGHGPAGGASGSAGDAGAGRGAAGASAAGGVSAASGGHAGLSAGGAGGSAGRESGFPLSVPTHLRIAAGNLTSCALTQSGVTCWGRTSQNSVDSGEAINGPMVGVAIASLSGAQPVCAIDSTGGVHCSEWGVDGSLAAKSISDCLPKGQIADLALDRRGAGGIAFVVSGGQIQVLSPSTCAARTVPTIAGTAQRISIAADHVCALTAAGSAACWDASTGSLEPSIDDHFVGLVSGSTEACGVTASGTVRCWDASGKEDVSPRNFPALVSAMAGSAAIVQIASDATGHNLCALFNDGTVACSQEFNLGSLGTFQLPVNERVAEIAVGTSHLCGIRVDDSVLCVPIQCTPDDCATVITPPPALKAAPRSP